MQMQSKSVCLKANSCRPTDAGSHAFYVKKIILSNAIFFNVRDS